MTTTEIIAWALVVALSAFVAWLVPYTLHMKRQRDRFRTAAIVNVFESSSDILRDIKWRPIAGQLLPQREEHERCPQ